MPFAGAFNFSHKCNLGFLASTADIIVLLNDDMEVAADGWLEELIAPIVQEARRGHDRRATRAQRQHLQHGGHRYFDGGLDHAFLGAGKDEPGLFRALQLSREASGATAACAALRRDVFEEVGGLTEELPANFNDIDLSLKILRAGYRILWMAHSVLFHFESRTRERTVHQWEVDKIVRRWGIPDRDHYVPTA